MPAQSAQQQIDEQRAANRSAIGYYSDFASHRERLTARLSAGVPAESGLRLCVLGAGNCYDLDLEQLGRSYREIHLVDIDEAAIDQARSRQDPLLRERIFCHAPVDLSGIFEPLERWERMQVTLDELMAAPQTASLRVASSVPGPFDVVVSACLLTHMQLCALNVLTDRHRLFQAVRQTLNLIHLRTLVRLLVPGGRALFVTDLASNLTYPLHKVDPKADALALMGALVKAGNVIYSANPELLMATFRDDPVLSRAASLDRPFDAWLWHNGPERVFLVYAMEITRVKA